MKRPANTIGHRDVKFSEQPCSSCGWHHQLDAFVFTDRVRVLRQRRDRGLRHVDYVGCIGTVIEWSQYGGPVYVRVQFGRDRDERENFDPCELEHA